jgi:hypothetical protein
MPNVKKPEFRKYAEGTTVEADKSRSELEALLKKHGASEMAFFSKEEGPDRGAQIIFRMNGMMIRQRVAYPTRETYSKFRGSKKENEIDKLVAAEYRRRWRALLLITKAKLEIVSSGESTIEREFLADFLLPNGKSVSEVLIPQLAESYESGSMPLLLGAGG